MDDEVIIFIPYGSRLGFHVGGPASTMANIDYKFPQCVCYEDQCYAIEGNCVDRNPKQNGSWISKDISPSLNTQDKHAVCYGVDCRNGVLDAEKTHTIQAKPQGGFSLNCKPSVCYLNSSGNGISTTLDVVYPINLMVATRGGRDDLRTCFGVGEQNDPQFTLSAAHEHGVCYAVENHPADSRVTLTDGRTCQTLTSRMGTGGGQHADDTYKE